MRERKATRLYTTIDDRVLSASGIWDSVVTMISLSLYRVCVFECRLCVSVCVMYLSPLFSRWLNKVESIEIR